MDWYKHSTGSHDDPDISDAMDEFGHPGYSAFFITLELYGDEYNHLDSDGWLKLSRRFVARKLRLSLTKAEQILNFYSERQRILIKIEENNILLNCPKFIEIASNWTKRKSPQTTEHLQRPTVVPTAIEEEKKKNKEGGGSPPPRLPYPSVISVQLWEDFVEHRRVTIRKPLTVKAASIIIRKLEKWKREGHDPTAIVEDAIANGWRGVFEPKNYPQKKKNPDWS